MFYYRDMDEQREVLGGNIELVGFNSLEPAKIIVIKKIVGNYVKKIADDNSDFEKLELELKGSDDDFELLSALSIGGKVKDAKVKGNNLFFALDKVMSEVMV